MKNIVIALAILTLATTVPTYADSYSVFVITHTQNEGFVGIDSSGDFTINVSENASHFPGCGGADFNPCFETFYRNQLLSPVITTVAPPLVLDNGSPCNPVIAPGMDVLKATCNNGHEVYGGFYNNEIQGVWSGPDPIADLILPAASFDGGFVNSAGDTVFIDGEADELIAAFDTTPEPSSFILFGTGCLSMLGVFRLKQQ